MSVVGLKKLILKDRLHTTSIESFLLRYYEQIISGVWGLMLLRPIESGIYWLAGDKNAAKFFSKRFLIIVIVYTIFLVNLKFSLSSATFNNFGICLIKASSPTLKP